MKKLLFILAGIVLFLVAFWVGLMLHFPGESVSRYVEGRINRFEGLRVSLTPAELRWGGLYVPRALLLRRDNAQAAPLFTFTDISIPLTWRLILGLPVRSVMGKSGSLQAFLPWSEGDNAEVQGRLVLQEIPVPKVFQPLAVKGTLTFAGQFKMDAPARLLNKLPHGKIEGQGENLEVSGVTVGGLKLPPTHIDALDWEVLSGQSLNVRNFTFRGDLQGTVTGTILPNVRNPRLSVLSLTITTSPRAAWVAHLGTLRPVVESFLERGRLVLSLRGTVGNPRLQQVKGTGP